MSRDASLFCPQLEDGVAVADGARSPGVPYQLGEEVGSSTLVCLGQGSVQRGGHPESPRWLYKEQSMLGTGAQN